MIYEVINPSDKVTFLADDDKIAYMATIFVSNGNFGCENISTETNLQCMFLFASQEVFESATTKYLGMSIEEFLKPAENKQALRTCLFSWAYLSANERKIYDAALLAITDPIKLEEFKEQHEDKNRTSMNRIVKRAWQMVDLIP